MRFVDRRKRIRRRRQIVLIAILLIIIAIWWLLTPSQPAEISPTALRSVALVEQADYTDTVAVFAGEDKPVYTSGCGAVCMSMAIGYLKNEWVSPQSLFEWAHDAGHYFGDGLGHEALTDMADRYGIRSEWLPNEPEPVIKALKAGYPVIAHMGPGTFTAGGHYILLRGVDDDGLIWVNDPSSPERTQTPYDMGLILRELRRANSFLLLKP